MALIRVVVCNDAFAKLKFGIPLVPQQPAAAASNRLQLVSLYYTFLLLFKPVMASLDEWATDQLGVFLGALGFDAEAIQTHILPDLARLDSPEAVMNHLTVRFRRCKTNSGSHNRNRIYSAQGPMSLAL